MSTDLYKRTIAFNHGNTERNDLMRKVWNGTPWLVDAHTGSPDDDRYREMREWCREQFGPECWPIHGKPGTWQTGSVTIYGWTWFGFATEDQMKQFLEAWPSPERATP